MTKGSQRFGKASEDIAAVELRRRGYKILEKNYRTRFGEIDLIAMDGGAIVFIEVKARRSGLFGSPKSAVTLHKQKKISLVAMHYLKTTGNMDKKARFDVVSVSVHGTTHGIEILKNAFEFYSA